MNFGSLFSGVGGLDLGLERAGMQCAWQVEIDEYATRVLERHWPDVPRWRDIADFIADAGGSGRDGREDHQQQRLFNGEATGRHQGGNQSQRRHPQAFIADAEQEGRRWRRRGNQEGTSATLSQPWFGTDLICGGFPCVSVSVAGRRAGMADDRWLWPEFRRVIELVRPRYVVIENVSGLLSADVGRAFGGILGDLARLGFAAEWSRLPAAAFGAPHLRWRVFIVAHRDELGCHQGESEPTLFGGRDGIDGGRQFAADASQSGPPITERETVQRERRREEWGAAAEPSWRVAEPHVCRVDDGFPGGLDERGWTSPSPTIPKGGPRLRHRVDRVRCLGNAVVPQVAQWIGQRIMEKHYGRIGTSSTDGTHGSRV